MHLKSSSRVAAVTLGAIACALGGGVASASAETLTGAGSTLVQPIESVWASSFQKATGNSVSFLAVGSGVGVSQVSAGSVQFGASDAPSTAYPSECSGCTWIPWALSATGIGYNLPHWGSGLKLTGQILSEIYLGQITDWDNSAIATLNAGRKLPDLKIKVVARSDASGDSYALTDYLSDVNRAFRAKLGATIQPVFPGAVQATGNSGVAGLVSTTPGAIGYMSVSYLVTQHVSIAEIKNQAGNYEYPNLSNIEDAAAQVRTVPATGLHIVEPPKADKTAYPISTFTNAVVPAEPQDPTLLKQFLTFAVTTGHNMGATLGFAALPPNVQSQDERLIDSVG